MTDSTMMARFERAGLKPFKPEGGMVVLEMALAFKTAELVAANFISKRMTQDALFRSALFVDMQGQTQQEAIAHSSKVGLVHADRDLFELRKHEYLECLIKSVIASLP
jgi:hypothetical protein